MKTLTALVIVLLLAPAFTLNAAPLGDTRLEGQVLGLDGRAAAGYRVHLIDDDGRDSSRAEVDADGAYRMRGVPPGTYALAIETPEGRFAAVDATALKVREGHLVRRDLKLIESDSSHPQTLGTTTSQSFGTWWAGLDKGARAWSIVAIVVVAGVTAEALSSDETKASEN